MITREFRAMGTTVTAVASTDGQLAATRRWFETVEQVCSRFRADSELSLLNHSEDAEADVSAVLAPILRESQRLRSLTGGLVDPAVGGAVRAWGYDRTFDEITDKAEQPKDVPAPQWSIDDRVVRRLAPATLDLGGIAKGWACDVAVEAGMAQIVSAGGDLRSDLPSATVGVADPWRRVVATVAVGSGALATSSTSRRRWRVAGDEVSHLIDPRTSRPTVSPIVSATVTARTAVDAEAGAKAVLLHGVDGLAWADECDWITGALVVWLDGSVYATTGMEVEAA